MLVTADNTVTVKLQQLDKPQASQAQQVTLLVPTRNTLPLGGAQVVTKIVEQPPLTTGAE
jgi:hypothetical protein